MCHHSLPKRNSCLPIHLILEIFVIHSRVKMVNLEGIPTPNSKGNSMARCWKMHEYDSTVCTDMRKSIKTTREVPGTTVIAFETHTHRGERHSQAEL